MEEKINIVGIGGVGRSGKDTLAEMFLNDGYFGVSGGDITRDFARERHSNDPHPIARVNLAETSNWLRQKYGNDVILKMSINKYKEAVKKGERYKGLLCWSIRAPIEADFIVNHAGRLIWIDVSDKVRYKRAMNDLREGEPHLSFEDYLAQESTVYTPQPGIPEEIQMNLPYVRSKATDIIENNSDSLEEFSEKAKHLIK